MSRPSRSLRSFAYGSGRCGSPGAGRSAQYPADHAAQVAAIAARLLLSSLLLISAVFSHYVVPAIGHAAVAQPGHRRLEQLLFWLSIGGLVAYGDELLALALVSDWIGSVGYQASGSLVLRGGRV